MALPSTVLCAKCGSHLDSAISSPPPSPVPNILVTNAIPSDSDVQLIHSTIAEVQVNITSLDSEIARVHRVLQRLQEQRKTLHRYATNHQALLSSIRRFPAEVLTAIFEYLLDPVGAAEHSRLVGGEPIEAKAVCKRWRSIVFSTPSLWSTIYIHLFALPNDERTRVDVEQLNLHLSRSGTRPLEVRLRTLASCVHHSLLRTLMAHSHRWKILDLELPVSALSDLDSIKNDLATLRNLSISIARISTDYQVVNIFRNAPQLCRLTLGPGTDRLDIVPWARLIHLLISTRFSMEQCCDVLQRCSRLEELDILELAGVGLPWYSWPTIHIRASIRRLNIVARTDISSLINLLNIPSLTEFVLHTHSNETQSAELGSAIQSLLRSAQALEILRLRGVRLDDVGLIDCLEASPLLKQLDLVEVQYKDIPSFTSAVARCLTVEKGSLCLSPQLRRITLCSSMGLKQPRSSPNELQTILKDVLKMVHSRRTLRVQPNSSDVESSRKIHGDFLREVKFGKMEFMNMDEEDRDLVRRMCMDGLSVTVMQDNTPGES